MTLERYLKELGDEEKPVKHGGLIQLSGLTAEETPQLEKAWVSTSAPRRLLLLTKMIDLAEETPELDFNAVFRLCLKDDDPDVREKAVMGLWECEDRAFMSPLISLLRQDQDEKVRSASAMALGKYASLAEARKLLPRDGEKLMSTLLAVIENKSESLEVRRRAIEAIGFFSGPVVKRVTEEAYRSNEPRMRCSAVFAMGRSCNQAWLHTIIRELGSDEPAMRYEAANACAEFGEEASVPHLVKLVGDDDPEVQVSALRALGAIGGPLAKRALTSCLSSKDDFLEEAARAALDHAQFNEDPLDLRFRN